jgi:hypothetical protein
MILYLANPRSATRSSVVDEFLEEVERQLALGRVVLCGHCVDVDVHDVLGQDHVALLVVLVLDDEDRVEPEK